MFFDNLRVCDCCQYRGGVIEDVTNGDCVCTECGVVQNDFTSHDMSHRTIYDTIQPLDTCRTIKPSNKPTDHTMVISDSHINTTFDKFEITRDGISHAVCELTVHYYIMFSGAHTVRGVVDKGVFICCIYRAFASFGVHRSMKEMCTFGGIQKNILTKSNKLLDIFMATYTNGHKISSDVIIPVKSTRLIRRMCEQLDIPDDKMREYTKKQCMRLDTRMMQSGALNGMAPNSIAVGIIAYVCTDNGLFSKQTICRLLDVSVVTIDKILKCIHGVI
jgi:transcription initiation factor TFIIIB Brf1 subunit/transcription initiation factor TFIIB